MNNLKFSTYSILSNVSRICSSTLFLRFWNSSPNIFQLKSGTLCVMCWIKGDIRWIDISVTLPDTIKKLERLIERFPSQEYANDCTWTWREFFRNPNWWRFLEKLRWFGRIWGLRGTRVRLNGGRGTVNLDEFLLAILVLHVHIAIILRFKWWYLSKNQYQL